MEVTKFRIMKLIKVTVLIIMPLQLVHSLFIFINYTRLRKERINRRRLKLISLQQSNF